MDAWAEPFSVVPFVHLPVAPRQRVLAIGSAAAGLVEAALRYPTTTEVVTLGISATPTDPRVTSIAKLDDLPPGWVADLVGVAVSNPSDALFQSIRKRHNADTGVAVFGVASAGAVRPMKDSLRKSWGTLQPFREWTGQAAASWYILAADHGFKRHRPVPAWTKRLSEKYLPALFTLAKDEYAAAYGGPQ